MGACSDEINKTVRKYLSQIKPVMILVEGNPAVAGRVEVDVGLDGKVTVASVSKIQRVIVPLLLVLREKVKRWKFPATCSLRCFPFAKSRSKSKWNIVSFLQE